MNVQNPAHTVKRYATLLTHRVSVLPVVVLMPHGACNCRCVMCDIWKGNKNAKQLTESDISKLLPALKRLDTRRVLMSGGEALLNRNFFHFCELLRKQKIRITLLTTGMTVARHAVRIAQLVDEVIFSLDGDQELHDEIRKVKGAFSALAEGVRALKKEKSQMAVRARCVIHRYNFRRWDKIIQCARQTGFDQISFLPADVSSTAFNRMEPWTTEKQTDLLVRREDLAELESMLRNVEMAFASDFEDRFIAESPKKLAHIVEYYRAHHGLGDFPRKTCNAPWVSAVIEADGDVRPCFFHDSMGSIHTQDLQTIINSEKNTLFRKSLNVNLNDTCKKCVCSLNLAPRNARY